MASVIDKRLHKYNYSINEDFMPFAIDSLRERVPRLLKVRSIHARHLSNNAVIFCTHIDPLAVL